MTTTQLETELGSKISDQSDIESEIVDANTRLEYTKYEINNLKDAIIEECNNSLEEKQQVIENLKEAQK